MIKIHPSQKSIVKPIRDILNYLELNKSILSYTFFGSCISNNSIPMREHIDIDTAIFVADFSTETAMTLNKINEYCNPIYHSLGLTFDTGIYYGAYKPPQTIKTNIFLHINLHTKNTFKQRHSFFKWELLNNSSNIIKTHPKKITPTSQDLIELCKNHLDSIDKIDYKIPYRDKETLTLKEYSIEDDIQFQEYLIFSYAMTKKNLEILDSINKSFTPSNNTLINLEKEILESKYNLHNNSIIKSNLRKIVYDYIYINLDTKKT